MLYRDADISRVVNFISMKMSMNIQAPPTKTFGVQGNVRHNPPLSLNIPTNVVEEIKILSHLGRLVIAGHKTNSAVELWNILVHVLRRKAYVA
jgi:hypothetical protein